ncbi:MAG TPA: glycoside hydrolase family 5 protein [Gemmatimonadaceae bacterium]|nr:glycoside hydrolase family 5 protein [Gemmatimonadaceae bacterium]
MRTPAERRLAALTAGALLIATAAIACAGRAAPTVPTPPVQSDTVRDLDDYPPVANDAPPGASASAVAMAAALGRGVNFGNMLEAPTEGAWGVTVTDDIIDKAKAAGFASVRLPVRWSSHASPTYPFTIDPAFMTRVEVVVDQLLAKGFVVMLNMHHYRQLDGELPEAGERAVAADALDLRFVMLWEQIAERFKGRSDRLLFELYNEPHGRINGAPWNVLAARALGVVRKTNPTRIVVIGPTGWNNANDLRLLRMPNDPHLIATIHNYAPFAFTHQGAEWASPVPPLGVTCCSAAQLAEMVAPLDVAKAWSTTTRYPVYVGEFGAYSKAPEASRIDFNRKMRDAIEARGMSWGYWEFAAGFGVYDPTARRFREALLQSLLGA